jgi:hypothetical protein
VTVQGKNDRHAYQESAFNPQRRRAKRLTASVIHIPNPV